MCLSVAVLVVALAAMSALLLLYGSVTGRRELAALVPVAPCPLERKLRVVIPARDEVDRLPATLDALLRDPSPQLEVVVYDDRSSDGTGALLDQRARKEPRLLVLHGEDEPPAGKFGKPMALARAVQGADQRLGRHDGLWLFLDSDVVLGADVLGGLARAFDGSGAGALSGVPRFECTSALEQLLVPTLTSLVGMRHPPRAVHDAGAPVAFLNGQLILIERRALDEVGGFLAVSDTVLEDVALAHLLKASGKALRLAALQPHARTRMYTSWREIDQGFGKNAVALFGGPARTVVSAVAALGLSCLPITGVVAAVVVGEPALLLLALTSLLVSVASQLGLRRALSLPRWPVLVLPLSYAGAAYVLVRAALRSLVGGEVTWRGRRYAAPRR